MPLRLRPSLLDLLTDDDSSEVRESETAASFSLKQLRTSILRDLSWLLNANRLGLTVDLQAYPEVARSALNFGTRCLTGHDESARTKYVLRNEILACLRSFEPRLRPDSLKVTTMQDPNGETYHFRIEAEVWAEPQPLHMLMRTQIGSTGNIQVVEVREDG